MASPRFLLLTTRKRQLTVGWEAADEKGVNADQTKQHEGVNVDQTKERWVVQFFLTVSL